MKKFTLIILCAAFGLGSMMAQKPKLKPSLQHNMAVKTEIVKAKEGAGRTSAQSKAPKKAPTVDSKGLITEPEGQRHEYQASFIYDVGFGSSWEGGLSTAIYYDESTRKVYIQDFVPFYGDGYYVEGTLVSGDLQNGEIEFANWQPATLYYSEDVLYAVPMYLNDEGVFDVDSLAETYSFNIHDGIIDAEEVGVCLMDKSGNAYVAQAYMQYEEVDTVNLVAPTIPETATKKYYTLSTGANASNYWDGNDVYFTGLLREATIKGTLRSDNKIAITTPQYVGKTTNLYGTHYRYFNSATVDEDGYAVADADGELLLDYNPETGVIKAPDEKYLVIYNGKNISIDEYADPSMVWTPLSEDQIPVSLPSDAKTEPYAMNSEYNSLGYHQGGLCEVCLYQDSLLYISRADGSHDGYLLCASLDKDKYDPESDVMPFSVKVGQPVGFYSGSSDLIMTLYSGEENVKEIEDEYEGSYVVINYSIAESLKSIDFEYNKKTKRITTDDILLFTNSGYAYSYSLYPEFYPVNSIAEEHDCTSKMVVFKEEDGQMGATIASTDTRAEDNTQWIVFDPVTYYAPKLTIQGTLSNGKFTMKVPQQASSEKDGYFLRCGEVTETYSDIEGYEYYSWYEWTDDDVDEVVCDYDEATGKITFPERVAVVGINQVTYGYDGDPLRDLGGYVAMPYTPHLATPAAPYGLELDDPSEDYWGDHTRWCLNAYIPNLDVDGNYLDYDSLTYRLYFDDEPFVFDPETYYPDFDDYTIDVPFNNPASSNIPHPYWSDNARMIYLDSIPQHKLGIMSTYHFDGETADSEIAWLDVEGLNGITSAKESNFAIIEWYDLSGRRIEKPQAGIYIQRKHFADGHVESTKVVVK